MIVVEFGGDMLFEGRFWQQIIGQLLGDELIVGYIFFKSMNNLIVLGLYYLFEVILIVVGVGILGDVYLVQGYVFGVGGGVEKGIYQVFLGIWVVVFNECVDFF